MSKQQKEQYNGITIYKDNPEWLSECGLALLQDGYLREGESPSQAFARAATAYCYGDYALAQRIYDYAYNNWFMFATPVLSNAPLVQWQESKEKNGAHYWHNFECVGEKVKGLPISCYAFEVPDSLQGQTDTMTELAELSYKGGGTGGHMSIRAPSKKAPGPIPYMKVLDSVIGYYRQQGRRGSLALYMDVNHPNISEHIRFRLPTGDAKMRSDNRQQLHNAVNLTDEFIKAVLEDGEIELVCPHSKEVFEVRRAREIWEDILETRALTGEPYLLKIDQVNRLLPETQKARGLKIKGSNLCSEILLPTDEHRTFVCCLSSVNLLHFDTWVDTQMVKDLIRFLDNVLQFFIDNCPDSLHKAKYSATQERALGLGAFGMAAYFQSRSVPFESGGINSAVHLTHKIFSKIKADAVEESKVLAQERGEAPDMLGTGLRGSRLLAIAPNASSGKIANTSPSREPYYRNIYTQGTRVGNFVIKNPQLEARLEELGLNTEAIWEQIKKADGSVQGIVELSDHDKLVFRCAMEMDQHWLIELADAAGQYICQGQSLNIFIPAGSSRKYVNSVHLKFLKSENVHTLYYLRTERESKIDTVKIIERQALADWNGDDDCKGCSG